MARSLLPFAQIIAELAATYGEPEAPVVVDPLEMILYENVAYLASDEQRDLAFAALRERVGTTPAEILAARESELVRVAAIGGVHAATRAERLRQIAQLVEREFSGDLSSVLQQPVSAARRALKRFPSIGDPGAEKILLFNGALPALALDSNGLRVLVRLGFGSEHKNYAATYRSAQEAVKAQLPADCLWLVRAHQLLRRHGQVLCKRTGPLCVSCPLTRVCVYYKRQHPPRTTAGERKDAPGEKRKGGF